MTATIIPFKNRGAARRPPHRGGEAPEWSLADFCEDQEARTARGATGRWWRSLGTQAREALEGPSPVGTGEGDHLTLSAQHGPAMAQALDAAGLRGAITLRRERQDRIAIFTDVVVETHVSDGTAYLTGVAATRPGDALAPLPDLVARLHPGRRYASALRLCSAPFVVGEGVEALERVLLDVAEVTGLADRGIAAIMVTTGVPDGWPASATPIPEGPVDWDGWEAPVKAALSHAAAVFSPSGHDWSNRTVPHWIEGAFEAHPVTHMVHLGARTPSATLRTARTIARATLRRAARARLAAWLDATDAPCVTRALG